MGLPPASASEQEAFGWRPHDLYRSSLAFLRLCSYTAGKFSLEVDGGITAFAPPKPQLILVSSAGVERFARHNGDEVKRAQDIPIVQLNPGGVLNHKYAGENAVRYAGVPYLIVRPTGITTDEQPEDMQVDITQGDTITGRISRGELADVVIAAAGAPGSVGKTFELRRKEGPRDLNAINGPTQVSARV